jgi:hypothetical protein
MKGSNFLIRAVHIFMYRLSHLRKRYSLALPYCFPCVSHHSPKRILVTSKLYQTVSEVNASDDALVDLLESIEHFLSRLDIYTKVPPTGPMADILVKIMIELLSAIALVTKHVKQKRPSEFPPSQMRHGRFAQRGAVKFVKKLLGENDVEAVLQRLDRLTQDEARTTIAQTLEVMHGLVQNMRTVLDCKQTHTSSSLARR